MERRHEKHEDRPSCDPGRTGVSLAEKVIQSAQNPPRKIPTFFQQLEWVAPDPENPDRPCALAGYGLSPETNGEKAGEYVHQVLQDPAQASQLKVHFFEDDKFEFWVNLRMAAKLDLKIPQEVLKGAKTFP